MDVLIDFNADLLDYPDIRRCTDLPGLARRLWTAFQLNGYIPIQASLPEALLSTAAAHAPNASREQRTANEKAYFARLKRAVHAVYEESRNRTKAALDTRRREALAEAYSTVGDEVMDRLQKLYEHDFKLFGYDPRPDFLFRRSGS